MVHKGIKFWRVNQSHGFGESQLSLEASIQFKLMFGQWLPGRYPQLATTPLDVIRNRVMAAPEDEETKGPMLIAW